MTLKNKPVKVEGNSQFSWYLYELDRIFLCVGPSGYGGTAGWTELGTADEDIYAGVMVADGVRHVMLQHAHNVLDYFGLDRTTLIERQIPWAG